MTKNIKEIGKELLGKSLNSFHRKTGLTQLEENNKMQDGILDGILSQVDNAYIEKTEQSNVIHLDGSGDGVVVLDSIEGNTMVNLIKPNYSNMSLHSGNSKENNMVVLNGNGTWQRKLIGYNHVLPIKPDTNYTVVVDIISNTLSSTSMILLNSFTGNLSKTLTSGTVGKQIFRGTTISELSMAQGRYFLVVEPTDSSTEGSMKVKVMIFEGHIDDDKIPPHIFGLQSSFEENKEEDKYKIEILSRIRNIINDIGNPHNIKTIYSFDGVKLDQVKPYLKYFNEVSGYNICDNLYDYYYTDNGVNIWVNLGTMDKDKALKTLNNRIAEGLGKSNKIKLLLNEPLRGLEGNIKDKLLIKDNKLVIERNCNIYKLNSKDIVGYWLPSDDTKTVRFGIYWGSKNDNKFNLDASFNFRSICNILPYNTMWSKDEAGFYCDGWNSSSDDALRQIVFRLDKNIVGSTLNSLKDWIDNNEVIIVYKTLKPIYEEVLNEYGEPILLEGYENGTLYIDSAIVPTTTVRYTPKMESFKTLNEVSDNNTILTNDINDNIIPYMMDVDLMIMEKEMASLSQINIRKMEVLDMTSMQKRTQDMLERLIKGKSLKEQECKTRVTTYLNAGKITDSQAEELMLLIDEVYA